MNENIPSGWTKLNVGQSKTINYDDSFLLLKRQRNLSEVLAKDNKSLEIFKNSRKHGIKTSTKNIQKSFKIKDFQDTNTAGSNLAMGGKVSKMTPMTPGDEDSIQLSKFGDYESLRNLRSDSESLVIGFDAEWYDRPRRLLSWQFALIHNNKLYEYVFIKRDITSGSKNNLWIELALARILDDLGYPRVYEQNAASYKCIDGLDWENGNPHEQEYKSLKKALKNARYYYHNGKPTYVRIDDGIPVEALKGYEKCIKVYNIKPENKISITLVGHSSIVDITSLNQMGKSRVWLLKHLTEAQGGVFSTFPIPLKVHSVQPSGYVYFYPINLNIRDSMCSGPAKKKKLKDLGEVIGVEKVELPDIYTKERMNEVLEKDFPLFLEYASTDAVIALLYTSAIYGINRSQSVTLLSSGTKVMKNSVAEYLNVSDSSEKFERVYRGLHSVKKGKQKASDGPRYIDTKALEPINRDAKILQSDACDSYHGGYNSCSDVGFYDKTTFDYDLQNAYPTAMCLVPDVDWANCILSEFEDNHVLTLEDFIDESGTINVFPMIFAYVDFEFPKSVKYPCIPMNVEGVLVFPRSSAGTNGTYVCGPELYLATVLGAKVTIRKGYKVNVLLDNQGNPSHSLKHAVKQLVVDRNRAKKECGKGSIEELILKMLVNGGYGKVAQDVVQKRHWDAYKKVMEDIGCSSITNPVSAAMITSIVRATLIAAQNQTTEKGFTTYSVTTDGFISDVPENVLMSLDLYGMRAALGCAREFLTDGVNSEIWEIKHKQNDLLNFTTRGNVSLITNDEENGGLAGVCAHNGAKSEYIPDSYEDRLWLMRNVLSRTGSIAYTTKEWTEFKKLANGEPFIVSNITRHIRMDFDMKRKPVPESMKTVHPKIEDTKYEIANFTTVPFETVDEFLTYRKLKDTFECLRAAEEWQTYFDKLSFGDSKAKPRNMEWSILNSVVMGYRAGMWDIPALDAIQSVDDKCNWINSFNTSDRIFKSSDWKNARRPERQAHILPKSLIIGLVEEMQSKQYKQTS